MAETKMLFDGASYAEGDMRKMMRSVLGSGVINGRLNELVVSAGSGMGLSVASGAAWVDGFFYESDAAQTVTLSAAHASLPRIDRIVVRVIASTNTLIVDKLTGTAAATPVAPALTQSDATFEIPLANIAVAAATGSIVSGNITDVRTQVGAPVYSPEYKPPLSQMQLTKTTTDSAYFNAGTYEFPGVNVAFTAGLSGTARIDVSAVTYINSGNIDATAWMGYDILDATNSTTFATADDARALEFAVRNLPDDYVFPSPSFFFNVTGLTPGHVYIARLTCKGSGGWFFRSAEILVTF